MLDPCGFVSFVLGNMACSQLQVMSDRYVFLDWLLLVLSGVLTAGSRMATGGTRIVLPLPWTAGCSLFFFWFVCMIFGFTYFE